MVRNVNNDTQSMPKVASGPVSESDSFRWIIYCTCLPSTLSPEDRSWYRGPLIGNQHSVVGTATRYGLDDTRIDSRWWWWWWWRGERSSAPFRTAPGAIQSPVQWHWVRFPEANRLGRGVHHPPHLAPRLKKQQMDNSNPPSGLRSLLYSELYLIYWEP